MKTIAKKSSLLLSLGCMLGLFGCATAPSLPEVTEEGLARVKDTQADAVFVLPGATLGGYAKVALIEPQISFRKNWQSDTGRDHSMQRVSDSDMQKMIAEGRKLLTEEFTKELTKGGYTVVTVAGPDVLVVKAAIVNLDVYAPDPDNMAGAWTKTYTDGAGEATLVLELFDSVTGQLLVRAFDHKSDANNGFSWRIPRSHYTNINDARNAFGSWAEMLVKGLDRARSARKS
jgi:hypothetical protein